MSYANCNQLCEWCCGNKHRNTEPAEIPDDVDTVEFRIHCGTGQLRMKLCYKNGDITETALYSVITITNAGTVIYGS